MSGSITQGTIQRQHSGCLRVGGFLADRSWRDLANRATDLVRLSTKVPVISLILYLIDVEEGIGVKTAKGV